MTIDSEDKSVTTSPKVKQQIFISRAFFSRLAVETDNLSCETITSILSTSEEESNATVTMTTILEQNKENIIANVTLGQFIIKKDHSNPNPKRPPLSAITNQHVTRETSKNVLLDKAKKIQDKQPLGPHESATKLRKPGKTPSSLGGIFSGGAKRAHPQHEIVVLEDKSDIEPENLEHLIPATPTPAVPATPRSGSQASQADPVLSTPLASAKSSAHVLRTPLQSPQVSSVHQTPTGHTPPLQFLPHPTPTQNHVTSTQNHATHNHVTPSQHHNVPATQSHVPSYSMPRPQSTQQRQGSVPPLIITPQLSSASVPPLRHHVPQVLVPMHLPAEHVIPSPGMATPVMAPSVLQPLKHMPRAASLPVTRVTHPLMSLDPQRIITVNGKTYISLDGEIGKGQSSRVHKVVGEDLQIYAIKEVKFRDHDDPCIPGYLQEVELLKTLQGEPFIIKLIDHEISAEVLHIVLEYAETDLARAMDPRKPSRVIFDFNSIRHYWLQMLIAVQSIHKHKIIHGDLKPPNFVLVKGQLRLIDFGISKTIPEEANTTSIVNNNLCGTIGYIAPEALVPTEYDQDQQQHVHKYGRAADVWSLGCILYQMVFGKYPLHGYNPTQRALLYTNPNFAVDVPACQSASCRDAILKCLQRDPVKRATIPDLLQHPFLKYAH